jgi:hypothetical protein
MLDFFLDIVSAVHRQCDLRIIPKEPIAEPIERQKKKKKKKREEGGDCVREMITSICFQGSVIAFGEITQIILEYHDIVFSIPIFGNPCRIPPALFRTFDEITEVESESEVKRSIKRRKV